MEQEFIQTIQHRARKIMRVSFIGILANIALAVTKLILGNLTGSIALTSDAFNNLTDSSSSLITIIGTRLAQKKPDKEHPFGHGRTEYLASLLIGLIVLSTGIQMLLGAWKAFGNKGEYRYNLPILGIMLLTVCSKIALGVYTQKQGQRLGSEALVASGKDAKNDALITAVTLLSALVYYSCGISLDAAGAALISAFVIKAGYEVLKDTLYKILGERADADMAKAIYATVEAEPLVLGAHDLILNNYGPDTILGSINVDIHHEKTVGEVYPIFHHLQLEIYQKLKIFMIFGIYAMNERSEKAKRVWEMLKAYTEKEAHILGYHGILVDEARKEIYCDILLDFGADREGVKEELEALLLEAFPEYDPHITMDFEFA